MLHQRDLSSIYAFPTYVLSYVEQVGGGVGAVVYVEHVGVDICGADWCWWTDQVFCTFVAVDVGS